MTEIREATDVELDAALAVLAAVTAQLDMDAHAAYILLEPWFDNPGPAWQYALLLPAMILRTLTPDAHAALHQAFRKPILDELARRAA